MGMTREEAIKVIRKMLAYTDLSVRANLTADMVDACHLAIKILEQEPILDKIRVEIENDWQLKKYPSSPFSCGLRRAIEIIDKHMESKENENIN